MFKQFLCLQSFFCLMVSTYSFASGADSSGGGMELGDRLNPWFLENQKTISYCIDLNEEYFSHESNSVRTLIERAFSYWTDQISLAQRHGYSMRLANQSLVYREHCSKSVDLRFLFGAVDAEVKNQLGDTREYIGIAVRTSYDSKSLVGKGFIYVSPDHGPIKFRSRSSQSGIWSKDESIRLYWLLVHEIGHVYGVQHFGSLRSVMGANFPEWLVNPDSSEPQNLNEHRDTMVFNYLIPRIRCGYSKFDLRDGLDYLKIKRDCIKFSFQSRKSFQIYQADSNLGPWDEIGKLVGKAQWSTHESSGAIMLFLRGKNWLHDLPPGNSTWRTILSVTRVGGEGEFQFQDASSSKPMRIDLAPNHLSISGIKDHSFASHLLDIYWP